MYSVTIAGLSIVYLSGRKSPDAGGNGGYSDDDVDALRALTEERGIVDIFMTYPCNSLSFFTSLSLSYFQDCIFVKDSCVFWGLGSLTMCY